MHTEDMCKLVVYTSLNNGSRFVKSKVVEFYNPRNYNQIPFVINVLYLYTCKRYHDVCHRV